MCQKHKSQILLGGGNAARWGGTLRLLGGGPTGGKPGGGCVVPGGGTNGLNGKGGGGLWNNPAADTCHRKVRIANLDDTQVEKQYSKSA